MKRPILSRIPKLKKTDLPGHAVATAASAPVLAQPGITAPHQQAIVLNPPGGASATTGNH